MGGSGARTRPDPYARSAPPPAPRRTSVTTEDPPHPKRFHDDAWIASGGEYSWWTLRRRSRRAGHPPPPREHLIAAPEEQSMQGTDGLPSTMAVYRLGDLLDSPRQSVTSRSDSAMRVCQQLPHPLLVGVVRAPPVTLGIIGVRGRFRVPSGSIPRRTRRRSPAPLLRVGHRVAVASPPPAPHQLSAQCRAGSLPWWQSGAPSGHTRDGDRRPAAARSARIRSSSRRT